jgi:hypothetical protein
MTPSLKLGLVGLAVLMVAFAGRTDAGKGTKKPVPQAGPLEMRLIPNKDTYPVTKPGKVDKKGDPFAEPSPGPEVDLVLEIRNVSDQEVTIWIDGDETLLTLDLKGPGAVHVAWPAPYTTDIKHSKAIKLAPGATYTRPLKSLDHGFRGYGERWYWTKPGTYTLTATYRLGGALGSSGPTLTSPPITIKVEA